MNKKRLEVFLEFLLFGIIMGVIEDLIAVNLATTHPINFRAVVISTMVSLPFAVIGELIVDKTDWVSKLSKNKVIKNMELFLEFLIFGVIMGIVEDLVAINLITGEPFSWAIVGIVTLVTIPFAVIGELIVDYKDLIKAK